MIRDADILDFFASHFMSPASWIAHAPGRVNLIGEHTDYNGGLVLPAAIDREVRMAARVISEPRIRAVSRGYRGELAVDLRTPFQPFRYQKWGNYLLGVLEQFRQRGIELPGLQIAIMGDVPRGAGLSSSAALEVCFATLLNAVARAGLGTKEIALIGQAAEHSLYVGVNCGIMDQFISARGERDAALLIDCHSLETRSVPLDSSKAAILILDSRKKRGLVDSEYNRRRSECTEALEQLRTLAGERFESLRHVSVEVFERFADRLPESPRRRARHNVTENRRVQAFAEALAHDDFVRAGALLGEAHDSMREDFEASCPEIDCLVDTAGRTPGVFGCRITGGGFGGCAVALAEPARAGEAAESILSAYREQTGLRGEAYVTSPSEGAGAIFLERP